MASETIGADELPRERHHYRWSDNSKVYTRKFNRNNKKNNNFINNYDSPTTTTTTSAADAVFDSRKGDNNEKENTLKDSNDASNLVSNGTTTNYTSSHREDGSNDNNKDTEKLPPSPVRLPVEEAQESGGVGEKLPPSPPRVSVEETNTAQPQEDEDASEKLRSSPPRMAVEEANSSQPQENEEGREELQSSPPRTAVEANLSLPQANEEGREELQSSPPRTAVEEANLSLPQANEDVREELPASPPRMPVEEANSLQPQENEDVVEELPPSPPRMPVEEANSSQPQENSLRIGAVSGDSSQPHQNSVRLGTASGDSSSLRIQIPVPNGHGENIANGSVSRPLITQVDDRLSISVSGARSKNEVRDLKRKLVNELDQVRKMAKKLDVKENQLNEYSSVDVESTIPVVDHLQFPVNGGAGKGVSGAGLRMSSETHSAGFNDSRPFRRLSVSVMNNPNNHHGVGEVVEKEKRTPKANQYYRNSEFLLGKDRLPPAESNRKAKSAGGKKNGGGDFDFSYRIDKKIFSKCSSLLQKIMNHKHGWVFNQPVDVKRLGLHDYFDIIKHPMDLGTVKARLTKNWYKTPREFAEDVRLTFHNALTYNPAGQDVHIMARDLLGVFEEKWPAIESEYDRKLRSEMIRDLGVPTPTSRKTYAPAHVSVPMSLAPPPLLHPRPSFQDMRNLERSQSMPVRQESRPKPTYSVGRKPVPKKPKAKDPHKRDMTFEEKQRLSTHLQSLPSEKLDAIVQIIKKRNSALSQHDDEIEVDIDSVDAETLWELDRFVTNYKKSLSKHKRKAELAQARAAQAAAQAAQETSVRPLQIPAPTNIEAQPRETTADEGNAATSPHVQREERNVDNNASGSSSSSSSSSDSGSSSSDSDSDSSSGSESDGGQ